jgi:Zn-dependent peptidase ImmA (M78 family)
MTKTSRFRQIVESNLGPPTNVEAIIRALGVELDKRAPLDQGIAGELIHFGDGDYKITANADDHYYRQRFTLAHELGHYMLHSHLIGDGVDDNKAYRSTAEGKFFNKRIGRTEESQANQFAARLLMPKSKVVELAVSGTDIRTLANTFQVSPAAMRIRLDTLGIGHEGDVVN